MTSMIKIVVLLHWLAVFSYIVSAFYSIGARCFNKPEWDRRAVVAGLPGLLFQGAGLLLWWYVTGHGPYMDRFEILSSQGWVMLAIYTACYKRWEPLRPIAIVAYPAAFLLVAVALLLQPEVRMLPPTFRSVWLVLHVIFYKVAFGAIILAGAFSLLYVLRDAGWRVKTASTTSAETLDLYAYRFAGFGFSFWAIAMLAGSIWAYYSWNIFWNWDPVQTWSLVTWLLFGLYLHMRRFYGWKGRKAAAFYLVCFVLTLISLFVTPFFNDSIHAEYFR